MTGRTGEGTSKVARPEVFARLRQHPVGAAIKAHDVNPFGHVFDEPAGPVFHDRSGREILNFGSNNYLGLTTHPRVVAAARDAVERLGTGCTGSRLLNGTMKLHVDLEHELADFYGTESALVTTTGFGANMAAVTGLVGHGDHVVCDRAVHASLLEGVAASGAGLSRFRHNDSVSLRRRLDLVPADAGLLVVVEGLYSTDGSVAPVPELLAETRRRAGAFLVDDAHGIGVFGRTGRGVCEELDCIGDIDLLTVTFSKSLASCGGAILGPADALREIRFGATSHLFTASNVPAAAAAALEALRLLRSTPELPAAVRRNGELLRAAAQEAGWRVADGRGPIVGLQLPTALAAAMTWKRFMERGLYCNVLLPPAAPPGTSMLRLSTIARHTQRHFDRLHDILVETAPTRSRVRSGRSMVQAS